ncbi:outer membrane beta-barrel protein [Winogradskyella sp. 3972H.M.0a.05]|uniref:outer membrane beta-barrel protein n=1 Tax=Winogradskyella sp. 3972H.M.0a.05 TaxID=2950277 RepID=UPI003393F132
MKKLVLAAFAVCAFVSVNAQNFGAGLSVGIPVGDAGDVATFNVTADVNYLWSVSDDFDAGATVGFSHNVKDEDVALDDIQFLPIAARGIYSISDEFSIGADLGYAVGINDGNDGGFLWAPRVGYGVSDTIDIVLSYNNVSIDGGTWSNINLGVNFGL